MLVTKSVVEQMKQDYSKGLSQGEIASKYNSLGYTTDRGHKLYQAAISVFLRRKTAARKVSVRKTDDNHSLYLGILKANGVDATKKVNTLISLME